MNVHAHTKRVEEAFNITLSFSHKETTLIFLMFSYNTNCKHDLHVTTNVCSNAQYKILISHTQKFSSIIHTSNKHWKVGEWKSAQ